jgi:hypothetical protein
MIKIKTCLNNTFFLGSPKKKVDVLVDNLYWEAIDASQYINQINYEGYMLK